MSWSFFEHLSSWIYSKYLPTRKQNSKDRVNNNNNRWWGAIPSKQETEPNKLDSFSIINNSVKYCNLELMRKTTTRLHNWTYSSKNCTSYIPVNKLYKLTIPCCIYISLMSCLGVQNVHNMFMVDELQLLGIVKQRCIATNQQKHNIFSELMIAHG